MCLVSVYFYYEVDDGGIEAFMALNHEGSMRFFVCFFPKSYFILNLAKTSLLAILMVSLAEWVAAVRSLKNCVVIVEGRSDAYALCSRGVSFPFLTCKEQVVRMLCDRLDALFYVLRSEHHFQTALILTDFDKEGEILHAQIKNDLINHVEVEDALRYDLKGLLKTHRIEDIRDFRISDLNASIIYQNSDLAPLKYVIMKFLSKLGPAKIGELTTVVKRNRIKVSRNRVRTELRDLLKKTYVLYDELSSRYVLSSTGAKKLRRSLLTIRIKRLDQKLS